MNDSFVFYESFAKALQDLPGEEFKECVMALRDYSLDGKEPEGGLAKGFLEIVKPYFEYRKSNDGRR